MREHFQYKLAAIDLDGTLLGPDKRIGPANRRAVARLREAGCRVVLASGRRHANMLSFYHELGLDDFIVSAQGALVKHPAGRDVIHHAPLPADVASDLATDAADTVAAVVFYAGHGAYITSKTPWTERLQGDSNDILEFAPDAQALARERPEKLIWVDAPNRIASLRDQMERRYAGRAIVTVTDPHLLEFTAPNATKAAGAAAIASRYNVDRAQVVAFGDGDNDVSILSWAGLGIAMPHAPAAVRAGAARVAPEGEPGSSLARAVDLLFAGGPMRKPEGRLATAAA